eukprot:scaffold76250_cov27-Tisochrysis_lutea.AAC.1
MILPLPPSQNWEPKIPLLLACSLDHTAGKGRVERWGEGGRSTAASRCKGWRLEIANCLFWNERTSLSRRCPTPEN